jgi:hypothetical protein
VFCHGGWLLGQFGKTIDGLLAQRERVARDCRFASPLHTWNATIQCRDQFPEFARELSVNQRHGWVPRGVASRRLSFQTSPHAAQRQ